MKYNELENMIVACVLQEEHCDYEYFIDNIKPHHFTREKYIKLIDVVKNILDGDEKPTPNLIKMAVSVAEYMDVMTEYNTISPQEFKQAINLIKIKYSKKQARSVLDDGFGKLEEDEATDFNLQATIDDIKNKLDQIDIIQNDKTTTIEDISSHYLERLDDLKSGNIDMGLDLKWASLKPYMEGRLDGNRIVVVGAYESIGKTGFALNIALNLLRQKKKVLFVSLEMSENQLMDRLVSISSKVPLNKLKTTEPLTDEEYNRIGKSVLGISNAPLFVNVSLDVNSQDVMNYAMSIKKKHGLDVVIVDYLQLLGQNEKGTDERIKVNIASRNMKRLAKVLNVPVFILSQVNRGSDTLCMAVPTRKQLKESGSIEADADIVMMIHRKLYDADGSQSPIDEQKRLIVSIDKNRDGARGGAMLEYNLETQEIIDKLNNVPDAILQEFKDNIII